VSSCTRGRADSVKRGYASSLRDHGSRDSVSYRSTALGPICSTAKRRVPEAEWDSRFFVRCQAWHWKVSTESRGINIPWNLPRRPSPRDLRSFSFDILVAVALLVLYHCCYIVRLVSIFRKYSSAYRLRPPLRFVCLLLARQGRKKMPRDAEKIRCCRDGAWR